VVGQKLSSNITEEKNAAEKNKKMEAQIPQKKACQLKVSM